MSKKTILHFSQLLILTFGFASAKIAEARPLYKVVGKGGVVTFTNKKPTKGQHYEVFRPQKRVSRIYRRRHWNFYPVQSPFDNLIVQAAKDQGIEPALVKAVVHVESAFDPKARSPKGAMGLMQLMPQTARRFGVSDAYAPEENLAGGAKYLKWLIARYSGNLILVLAAYNAGEAVVDRLRNIPPYRETQNYVRKVQKALDGYRRSSVAPESS